MENSPKNKPRPQKNGGLQLGPLPRKISGMNKDGENLTTNKEKLIEMLKMRIEEVVDIDTYNFFYEDPFVKWLFQNLAILQYMNEQYAPFLQ